MTEDRVVDSRGTLRGACDNYQSLIGAYVEAHACRLTIGAKKAGAHRVAGHHRLVAGQELERGIRGRGHPRGEQAFGLDCPARVDIGEVDDQRAAQEPRGDAAREAAVTAGAENDIRLVVPKGAECRNYAAAEPPG